MADFQTWLQVQKMQMEKAEVKRPSTISVQDRFDRDVDDAFQVVTWITRRASDIPPWRSANREQWLREFWQKESILAGAVHSAIAKIIGLSWTVSGGRNKVSKYAAILREADGKDWDTFLSKFLLDYLTQDKGTFIEFGSTFAGGPVEGIFNLDSGSCALTGDWDYPVKYRDKQGQWHNMPRTSVYHSSSLPSANSDAYNYGFCAVSRAIHAAQILILVNRYENEKLSDLPPNGIAAVTGLTPRQFRDAMRLYKSTRERQENLVYPGILWLVGNPGATGGPGKVSIDLTSFADLPDQFDKKSTVDIYAKTLALAFGVDVNEFWQIEHVGATKASAWIQAQKAKGKFPAVIIAAIERAINTFVLPPGVVFKFGMMDAEDRLGLAELHAREIENVSDMIGSGVMTPDEGKALLLRKAVIPTDMEAGLDFVESDISGFKTAQEWDNDGGYVILDRDGQIIYDRNKKGYVIPHKIDLPNVTKTTYRASDSDASVTEAPVTEASETTEDE